MNHKEALANLRSKNANKIINSLVYLGTNGNIHDVNHIAPLFNSKRDEIRISARGTAATIIKDSMLDSYETLPESSKKKLGILLKKLAPDLVHEITHDLKGHDEKHRINAIQILNHIGYDPAIKNLISSLLKSPDTKIRATATKVLGSVLSKNEHRYFQDLLSDGDTRVRANAIEAIEHLNDEGLIYLIIRFKHDPNNRIRANALKALFSLGRKKVAAEIIQMIHEGDPNMVLSGMWVIRQLKLVSIEAVERCAELTRQNNLQLAKFARQTLEEMDSPIAQQYL